MSRPSLGLIMIVKDEAKNLPRSLAPIAASFDEVVVVDTGSKDGTPAMAASMGAEVYDFNWVDDFSAARNYSIEKAKSDWLFWLDADNAILPSDVTALREAIDERQGILWALEKVVPSGEQLWQKRCFANRPEVYFKGRVHEQLVHPPYWPQKPTKVVVAHWGYQDKVRLLQKGRYYQDLLNQMLEDDPSDYYAHFQIARCLCNQRKFNTALDHLSKVISSKQARTSNRELWAHAHFQLANTLERQGRPLDAVYILNQLIEVIPHHGLARYQAGRLAYAHQDWERAAEQLNMAIQLGINAPVVDSEPDKILFLAHYFMGRSLMELKRHPEAKDALRQAVDRNPDNLAATSTLAEVLLELGERDAARAEVSRILRIRPGDRRAAAIMAKAEKAA